MSAALFAVCAAVFKGHTSRFPGSRAALTRADHQRSYLGLFDRISYCLSVVLNRFHARLPRPIPTSVRLAGSGVGGGLERGV